MTTINTRYTSSDYNDDTTFTQTDYNKMQILLINIHHLFNNLQKVFYYKIYLTNRKKLENLYIFRNLQKNLHLKLVLNLFMVRC